MIKLSELKDDETVIDENLSIYDVGEVKNDLKYFKDKGKKIWTTTEYQACIDDRDVLENAIESEYDNMYEDWNERILDDVTDEDIAKLQAILDDILNRSKEQNIAYYQGKEIDMFN